MSTPTVARDVATGRDESGQPANHKGKAASVAQRPPQTRGSGLKVLRGALRAMLGLKE